MIEQNFRQAGDRSEQHTPSLVTAACVASVLAIIVLRRPEAVLAPAFRWEEVAGFWVPTFVKPALSTLFLPWNGFIYLVPRAAFLLARVGPAEAAPIVTFAVFVASIGLVAAFVAGNRLAEALPGRSLRLLAALGLALLPFAGGEYASVLHVHWWLAIYLAMLLVAAPPTTRRGHVIDAIGALLGALDGPAVIALAPLYLLWRRDRRGLTAIVSAGALVQFAAFITSPRRPSDGSLLAVALSAGQQLGTTALGDRLPSLFADVSIAMLGVSLVSLVAFAGSLLSLPSRTYFVIGYLTIALAVAGAAAREPSVAPLPARYEVVGAWAMLVAGAASALKGGKPGLLLVALLVAGIAGSLRMDPLPAPPWAPQARCIGSPSVCRVTVYPADWSFEWRGIGASLRLPVGIDASGAPVY